MDLEDTATKDQHAALREGISQRTEPMLRLRLRVA